MAKRLTHLDESGAASMVDVSDKPISRREAVASAFIRLQSETLELIAENRIKKGDVLGVARIAGIGAAKQTQHLIPLCHQLPLSKVGVEFEVRGDGILVTCTARTTAQTGVEMEALTGASLAALSIYDMCKAVDKEMVVEDLKLLAKTKQAIG
ncbi:MAG: cyclic pyranopterin monophosphate synthase MoaC [Verrucomicrobiales bacterium]